jgi:hypothetical protein
MTATAKTVDRRPVVGDRVRVRAANSERDGEYGTVTHVSARGIVTVWMDEGVADSAWPRQELAVVAPSIF